VPIEILDQPVGGIAELADMQDVGVGIVLGTPGDGRTAEHDRTSVAVRAPNHVVDARTLHVHARDEDRVGPAEIVLARGARVLVDEAHVPRVRQIGGHGEQTLRRHERSHTPAEKRVRVLKGPEGARVDGIHAENPAPRGRCVRRAHGSRG
jgi:hypothetical protein